MVMIAATLPKRSQGPVREFRICSSGPSQGIPLPAARSIDGHTTTKIIANKCFIKPPQYMEKNYI
jgi:hypothetical protein